MTTATRRVIESTVADGEAGSLLELLADKSQISKRRLKQAMQSGAVWQRRRSGKLTRIRKATAQVKPGDFIALYYDEAILAYAPEPPVNLWSCREYSLWFKPAGVLAQGSEYGDHAALPRIAQLADPLRKEHYVVHRLDREAYGLMLLARTQTAARRLSQLFQRREVEKDYVVMVLGETPCEGRIEARLDGKPALTIYQRLGFDATAGVSTLRVSIETGRTHQIRRHFEHLGFPVLGDPRYGKDNQSAKGLALCAQRLAFTCPFRGTRQDFVLDKLYARAD